LRKRLALLVLLPVVSANAEVVARFEREAMAAGRNDHPNVAAATDFGRTPEGAFFLVLEYIEGESLRQALATGGPFDADRAVRVAGQIASALARAHSLGIVHRDLKPDNVMLVRRDDPDETVKVLDFGIAKLTGIAVPEEDKVLTRVGAVFGTPEYMSPEQAMGEAVDARADLYALGVTLYEMLTGLRPFESDNPVVLLTMHVTAPPPPMSVREPRVQVPPALEALVMNLLAKRPADRVATAQEVERSLQTVLASGSSSPGVPHDWTPAAAAAKTNLALPSSDAPSGALAAGALAAGALARRLSTPDAKRALAAFAAVALVVMIAFAVRSMTSRQGSVHHAAGAATGGSVAATSWLPFAPKLTDARVEAASRRGAAALAELEREFPADARVPRELVRWHVAHGQTLEALSALGRLAALDASLAAQPEMERVIDAAIDGNDPLAADAAIRLLEESFGARGVDELLERSTHPSPSRAKIQRSLKKPEVRAHASPAAGVTLDLRDAKTCDAKRELLERAQSQGDARTLAQLNLLRRTNGCGFFSLGDCWRCLRKDSALEDAITALEAKH
jgi:serine/threonine-protein kinase